MHQKKALELLYPMPTIAAMWNDGIGRAPFINLLEKFNF